MIMMGGDKKKLGFAIIESMGPSKEKNAESYANQMEDQFPEDENELMLAASDVMKAFHAKDVGGLKDALFSFHSCAANCVDNEEEDEEESEA